MLIWSVMFDSLWPHGLPGSSVHGDSPGKNTGVGYHALLQGIFPTEGSNPGFPHCRQILYHLSHQGSPRILEWVAYSFSRGSSWSRNWTIKLGSPALQADSLTAELPGKLSTPDQKFQTRLVPGQEYKLQTIWFKKTDKKVLK